MLSIGLISKTSNDLERPYLKHRLTYSFYPQHTVSGNIPIDLIMINSKKSQSAVDISRVHIVHKFAGLMSRTGNDGCDPKASSSGDTL